MRTMGSVEQDPPKPQQIGHPASQEENQIQQEKREYRRSASSESVKVPGYHSHQLNAPVRTREDTQKAS